VLVQTAGAGEPALDLALLPSWVDEVLLVEGGPIEVSFEATRRLGGTPLRPVGASLRGGLSTATGELVLVLDAATRPSLDELSAVVLTLLGSPDTTVGMPSASLIPEHLH